ncbi:MAG: glycosyltransferase family 4 protein [Candidatus Omnitrophota bacterium]|nr:MAG: glycosyltransferase family 4 protein [Candidatus Omnitrophota bacterium]
MKIAIVTHNLDRKGGQGQVNYEIAQEVLRQGHQLIMIASNIDSDLRQHPLAICVFIPVHGWPTQLLRNLIFAWRSSYWLHKHLQSFDLAVATGFTTWASADVNIVQFVHSAWLRLVFCGAGLEKGFYGIYQRLYTAINAWLEKKSFRKSKVIVAVSEKIRQELMDIIAFKERIYVIHNGVDLDEFFSGSGDRVKFGLPEGVALAVFVGDIKTHRKNLDTVLMALAEVSELHLAVVGNTKRSKYPKLAEKLGLSGRAHFMGYRKDVAEIMRASDFFVFPSRYDPWGIVVSEAMASGLPIITAKTVGASEIVTPQCGVVLDDPNDVEGLVKALRMLVDNSDLRKQMGQAARVIAEQHSWVNKAKEYVDLFEEICKSKVNK